MNKYDCKVNRTLKSLNLGSNHMLAEGAASISNALKANLSAGLVFYIMIQTNCTLTKLSLFSNEIGARGAAVIGEALQASTVHEREATECR